MLSSLFACSNTDVEYEYPKDPQNVRNLRAGKFFGDIVVYDGNKKRAKFNSKSSDKNSKNILWIASFEVISALFPIALVDSNSGVIVTDWYMDGKNKNARVKINVLVKDQDIKEKNLVISIFRQEKNDKDQWQDQQLNDKNLAIKLISGKILDKAKVLKFNKD